MSFDDHLPQTFINNMKGLISVPKTWVKAVPFCVEFACSVVFVWVSCHYHPKTIELLTVKWSYTLLMIRHTILLASALLKHWFCMWLAAQISVSSSSWDNRLTALSNVISGGLFSDFLCEEENVQSTNDSEYRSWPESHIRTVQGYMKLLNEHSLTESWLSEPVLAEWGVLPPSASPHPPPCWRLRAGMSSVCGAPGHHSWLEQTRTGLHHAGLHQASYHSCFPARHGSPFWQHFGYDSSESCSRHFAEMLRLQTQAAAPRSVSATSGGSSRKQMWRHEAAWREAPRRRRSDETCLSSAEGSPCETDWVLGGCTSQNGGHCNWSDLEITLGSAVETPPPSWMAFVYGCLKESGWWRTIHSPVKTKQNTSKKLFIFFSASWSNVSYFNVLLYA